jgi:hypothetical protein
LGVVIAVAIGVFATAVPVASAAPKPPPLPFAVLPIAPEAGYFTVQGSCPKYTYALRVQWSPAPNGVGYAEIFSLAGNFSVPVRMLATAPGETINVTVACMRTLKRANSVSAPMQVVSGTDLLPVPAQSGGGRRIVYSLSAQQMWVLEADESVVRTYLVSGRRLRLDGGYRQTGSWKIFAKKNARCGGQCLQWLSVYRSKTGTIAFHQIPLKRGVPVQADAELGQPRSEGCVRQSATDAAWLWQWAAVGERVVMVP